MYNSQYDYYPNRASSSRDYQQTAKPEDPRAKLQQASDTLGTLLVASVQHSEQQMDAMNSSLQRMEMYLLLVVLLFYAVVFVFCCIVCTRYCSQYNASHGTVSSASQHSIGSHHRQNSNQSLTVGRNRSWFDTKESRAPLGSTDQVVGARHGGLSRMRRKLTISRLPKSNGTKPSTTTSTTMQTSMTNAPRSQQQHYQQQQQQQQKCSVQTKHSQINDVENTELAFDDIESRAALMFEKTELGSTEGSLV